MDRAAWLIPPVLIVLSLAMLHFVARPMLGAALYLAAFTAGLAAALLLIAR